MESASGREYVLGLRCVQTALVPVTKFIPTDVRHILQIVLPGHPNKGRTTSHEHALMRRGDGKQYVSLVGDWRRSSLSQGAVENKS